MNEIVLVWLATYLLHSTVLIGAVWALERARVLGSRDVREWAWRIALFGAIATSIAQVGAPRLPIDEPAAAKPTAAAAKLESKPVATAPRAIAVVKPAPPEPALTLPATTPARSIASAWAAFALAGVLLTLGRAAWLALRARRLPDCDDARVLREVESLARLARIAPPRVAVLDRGESPLVAPVAQLCVPRWTLESLDAPQRDAMLAHELAHVLRRDPLWRLGAELVRAALFFQPLNTLATRRLDALAELGCDAWAARTRDPRALAECLVACAERLRSDAPALAAAMARKRSPLIERIHSLLDKDSAMTSPFRTWSLRIAIAAALPAVMLLPAIGVRHAIAKEASRQSIEIESGWFGSFMNVSIDTDDGSHLNAKVKGEIKFNDGETDVATLGDNATFEEIRGGAKRRVELKAGRGGAIEHAYFVDGKEQPWDATAQRWFGALIPTLLRETGIQAAERAARIHKRGGADALLAEIALIRGDYARRNYVVELAKLGQLDEPKLAKAIALVEPMHSDYERRESLDALLEHQRFTPASEVALLGAVAKIGSDYEQRTVLEALAPKQSADPAVTDAWARAIDAIDSDYEARTAIAALAERGDLDATQLEAALRATPKLGSDYEQREALTALAPQIARSPRLAAAYAKALSSIGSAYERRTAISELLAKVMLDRDGFAAVLDAIDGIDSDFDCRTALVEVAEHMPADEGLIKRYRAIARKLGDYERGQAEKALDRFAAL